MNRVYVKHASMWNWTLYGMRIACPLALVAALVLAYFSWRLGHPMLLAVNMFLAGINAVLTWFQWRVFQPRSRA